MDSRSLSHPFKHTWRFLTIVLLYFYTRIVTDPMHSDITSSVLRRNLSSINQSDVRLTYYSIFSASRRCFRIGREALNSNFFFFLFWDLLDSVTVTKTRKKYAIFFRSPRPTFFSSEHIFAVLDNVFADFWRRTLRVDPRSSVRLVDP